MTLPHLFARIIQFLLSFIYAIFYQFTNNNIKKPFSNKYFFDLEKCGVVHARPTLIFIESLAQHYGFIQTL